MELKNIWDSGWSSMQRNKLGWRISVLVVALLFLIALIYSIVQLIQALGVSS